MKRGNIDTFEAIRIKKVQNGFIIRTHGPHDRIDNEIVLEHPDNRYLGASIKHFMETGEAIDPDDFASWNDLERPDKLRSKLK